MQNDSKKFKKFKKLPLLLAVLFLMFSSAALALLYKKINDNERISLEFQAKWQAEASRRDEIRSLERSIKEIESERAEIDTHFAESSNVVPFLDTLEKLATDAGADSEVTSVDIGKEKPELMVSLRTTGSFSATYKFIQLLENSPYELEIASFDIERQGTAPDPAKTMSREWDGFFTIRLLSFIK